MGLDNNLTALASTIPDYRLEDLTDSLHTKNLNQINDIAKEFETLFLSKFLNAIYENVSMDPLVDDKKGAGKIYKSWVIDEYSKLISASGTLHIADSIRTTLLKYQEVSNARS